MQGADSMMRTLPQRLHQAHRRSLMCRITHPLTKVEDVPHEV